MEVSGGLAPLALLRDDGRAKISSMRRRSSQRVRSCLTAITWAALLACQTGGPDGSAEGASTSTQMPAAETSTGTTGTVGKASSGESSTSVGTTGCQERMWFPDGDGDGWGVAVNGENCPLLDQKTCEFVPDCEFDEARGCVSLAPSIGCEGPPGWADQPGDCDDNNAAVAPGLDELCGDELDNDCDGTSDEWSPSNPACNGCLGEQSQSGAVFYVCGGFDYPDVGSYHCGSFGAVLASIHSEVENDTVRELLAAAREPVAFIGLLLVDGQWQWDPDFSDGTDIDYTNWARGYPSMASVGESCGVMQMDGTWRASTCEDGGGTRPLANAVVCRASTP